MIDRDLSDLAGNVITNMDRWATDWLKDEDREAILKRIRRRRKRINELSAKLKNAYAMIDGLPKTARESFVTGMNNDQAELYSLEAEQRQDKRELAMYKNKDDMLAEFNKALKSLKLNRQAAKTKFDQAKAAANIITFKNTWQMEVKAALDGLPFNDRKRILDTVFNREAGGKIFIRPVTGADLVDDPAKHSRKALNKPIKGQYQYELDFKLDLNRIVNLINSLNKKELLIKNAYEYVKQHYPARVGRPGGG